MNQPFDKVFKSPINTSISKNLYSFPKTQRFQRSKQSECKRSFYQLGSTFSTRATNFGYGDRTDLINKEQVPSPGNYNYTTSAFLNNKIKKRGYSFGGQIKTGFPYQNIDKNNPGPGKYQKFFFSSHKSASYSIRSKYQDPQQAHKNPLGPGQYRVLESISKTGNYFNSKFKSSACGKIGRQKRFQDDSTLSPGPGKYKNNLGINPSGKYFNTRFKSNFVSGFQGVYRPPINEKSQTPGPGTYYVFSQFGERVSPSKK